MEFITSPVNIEVSQPTGGTLGTKDLLQCALSDGDDTSIEDWCIDGTKPEKVCSTVDPTKYYDLYLEMSTLISYQILVPTKQTRGIDEFVSYLTKHGGSPTIDSIGEEFETTQDPAVEFTQLSEGKQYKSTLASILLARSAKIQQLVPQELVIQHILDYSPADRASKNVMSLWTAEFPTNKQIAIARTDGKGEIFLPEIKEKDLGVETETGHDRKRKNMGLITSPVDIEITRCGNKHGCLKSSNDHGNDTDSDTRERTKQAENGGATASNEAGSSDHVPSSASGAEGSSGGDGDDGGSDKKVNCRSCADDDDDYDPVANEHEAPPLVVAVPKAIELKNQSEIQANNSEGSRNLICFQQFESWEIPEETFPHMIRTTLQPGIVKDPPQGIPSSTRLGELPMLQNSSSSIRANRLRDVDPELAEMFQRLNELDQPDEWNNQPSMDTTNQTPPVTSYHQGASDNPLVPDTALSFCDDLRMQQDQSDCPLQHNQLYFPFPQLFDFPSSDNIRDHTSRHQDSHSHQRRCLLHHVLDTVSAVTTIAVKEEFQYLICPIQPTEEQITAIAVQEENQYCDQQDQVISDAIPEVAEGAHEDDEAIDRNILEQAVELFLTAPNEYEESCFDVRQAQAEDLPVVAENARGEDPYVDESESSLLRHLVVVIIGVQEKEPDVEEESQPLRPEIIQHPVEN